VLSDVLKLQVIDAFADECRKVSDIEFVQVNPIETPQLDMLSTPALFIWDREGDEKEFRNRLEVVNVPLALQLWVEGTDYERRSENIRGQIQEKIYTSLTLKDFNAGARDISGVKFYGEQDLIGGIDIRYQLQFLSNTMDPFSQLNY